MLRLKSLTMEALRGATQPFELKFEAGRLISIVYGENGAGKTTICDAFDLLGNEKLGSLDGKGLGTTSRYWHATNRRPADIRVTLATNTGTWTAKISGGKEVVFDCAESRPSVRILRRHQLLDLIAGRPGDRYEALHPFVAIDGIDESERSLRNVINEVKNDLREAAARTSENEETIGNLWNQAGAPAPSMMEWAEAEAERDTADLDESVAVIQKFLAHRDALVARIGDLENAKTSTGHLETALSKADAELNRELGKAAAGSQELTRLLQAARHFFEHQRSLDACPLCGSREFAGSLPETVEKRLRDLESLQTAINTRDAAKQSVVQAQSLLDTARGRTAAAANELCAVCAAGWHSDLPSPASVTQIRDESMEKLSGQWTLSVVKRFSEAANLLARTLEPDLTLREQRKTLLRTVRDALEQYHHNLEQRRELDALLPRLEAAHEVLVEERRGFVDEILGRIAARVGELYEAVHPGEGLSKISLQLDPKKRASLDVVSHFPGAKASPPAAYLSESHLDTLGLCIFLALAEEESPEETILVLDDVVVSVDEPHVDRIIEMVYGVAERFAHCILTTHYIPWREKYRWGWLKNKECQFVELGAWSWDEGIVTSKSTPRVETLRSLLENSSPDAQQVSASAGVVLESVLDFLTGLYECAVPRRRTKPTLGDLLPAVNKRLRAALRIEMHDTPLPGGSEPTIVKLGLILDRLQEFAQLRNVMGCHFNDVGFHLPEANGIEFGRTVLELADALVHPDDGWPGSDRSGEYWTNSGKSRRLYPLKQPS